MKNIEIPLELDNLFNVLNSYLPATDVAGVQAAYKMAAAAHAGQTRVSGEPYITHSLAVTQMLADLNLEVEVIIAGLLHDVPEDTPVTLKEIEQEFGPTVARLVDGVTKLKQASDFKDAQQSDNGQNRREYQHAENLRKMFLAIGEDVRVVLIKLADRLHNMRTLGSLPDYKRRRIARETMDIFAPLANRLGIYAIKWELEDLSFKYLFPKQYYEIARKLDASRTRMDRQIGRIATELETALKGGNIEARLVWRSKHLFSIYQKMQRKEVDITQIFDVKALRVLVKTIKDCYATLGVVHSKWRPIPGEFDDYIAAPKENGYQSLHTAVIDSTGQQFEVQIRTEDMHQQAELGIAAHWHYKDGTKADPAMDQKIMAMRQAIKLQAEGSDASEFVAAIKSDIIQEKVFVFTPKGDILELPLDSTPIDFAYHVHTEVGHKCRGAKVNGVLVGLDYQLHNGDKVEILTAKRGGPSRDWLNENLGYLKSNRARRKVRHWFKRQNYQESITQGRSILDRELKRLHLSDVKYEDLAVACGYQKTDSFLAALGYNDISLHQIVQKTQHLAAISKQVKEKTDLLPIARPSPTPQDTVSVKGVSDLLTSFARCCRPVPGDPIVGYITRGRGISIHRRDCSNILRMSDRERLIEVTWGVKAEQTYPVATIIRAFDRQGLMRDISEVIANESINITDVNVNTRNHIADVWVTLEVTDLYQLKKVMDKIEQLPNVIEVTRKR